MSDRRSQSWSALLADKRSALAQWAKYEDANITNERDSQQAWRDLCDQHHERDGERLLSLLQNQHLNIIDFTETVETALDLEDDTLTGVFWTSVYKVIQATSQKGVQLRATCLFFAFDIPDLGPKVSDFLDNQAVQAPLRSIFDYILEFQFWKLQYLDAEESFDLRQFNEHIHTKCAEIEGIIEVYKTEWEEKSKIALEEQALYRQRSISGSTISAFRGLDGQPLFHSYANDSFIHTGYLGYGFHTHVESVRHQNSDELLARKVIRCSSKVDYDQRLPSVLREVEALKKLPHHHIVALRLFNSDSTNFTFSIVMYPVAHGDLGHYLKDTPDYAKFNSDMDSWFGCLISALQFAHARKVIHQDIKPQNIIIKDDQPLLMDFGAAKDFSMSESSISREIMVHGTLTYLAPEDEPGEERGRATDVFSLGCVFAEMLTVRQGENLETFMAERRLPDAVTVESPFRANLPAVSLWISQFKQDSRSKFLVGQILNMLTKNSAQRPNTRELKNRFRGADLMCDICS